MYTDEEDRRIARVQLGFIVISVFALQAMLAVGLSWGDTSVVFSMPIGSAILLIPLFFLFRGKLSLSNFLSIGLFIALITAYCSIGYGIHDYAILGYPAIIVFAGMAEQRRGLIASTTLTILALTWLVFAEIYGLFAMLPFSRPTWADLVLSILGILMGAGVVNLLVTNLKAKLTQLRIELAERARAEQELIANKSLIQSITDSLVSGMIYQVALNEDGARTFTYLSDGVRKLYGAEPADVVKDPSLIYARIHPEDRERLQKDEEAAIHAMSNFRTELRVINPDGSVRWSSFISNPKRAEGGVTYWNAIEVDITERKQAEERLQRANQQLSAQLEEIQKLQAELHEQILRDPLTGLYNRRYLDEALQHEIYRAAREKIPFSLIVMDIDHFKKINDTYGHPVGDLFLIQIGNLLKQHIRGMDTVCRFGGEEFLLMLPGADANDAFRRSEEIRLKCAAIRIAHEGQDLRVTISLGVASYPAHSDASEKLLIKADKAMYRSKQNGRNQTTVWEEANDVI